MARTGVARHTAYGAGRGDTMLRRVAAALAFSAQLIHLWVLPQHFVVWPFMGLFFALVAACQGILGASLLLGPGKWTLRFGVLFNLFVASVWAFTRIVGVPAWTSFIPEPVGVLDFTATGIELALVTLLVTTRRILTSSDGSGG